MSHVVAAATPPRCRLPGPHCHTRRGDEWAWPGCPALGSGKRGGGGICAEPRTLGLGCSLPFSRLPGLCSHSPAAVTPAPVCPDRPACFLLETWPLGKQRLNRTDSMKCFIPACRFQKKKKKKHHQGLERGSKWPQVTKLDVDLVLQRFCSKTRGLKKQMFTRGQTGPGKQSDRGSIGEWWGLGRTGALHSAYRGRCSSAPGRRACVSPGPAGPGLLAFSERPEIRAFMRNIPILKCWQAFGFLFS